MRSWKFNIIIKDRDIDYLILTMIFSRTIIIIDNVCP